MVNGIMRCDLFCLYCHLQKLVIVVMSNGCFIGFNYCC